jgi:hypothetical protein
VSATRQEILKANLKRFQEVATRMPKVTEPSPAPPKAPPEGKARAAPVGEILSPDRNDFEAFSPGARMAEANLHVRNSVREASLIIRDSEVFFVGAKQSVSVTAGPGTEEAAETVRQAERSVAEALEFVLGPSFMDAKPSRKVPSTAVVEGAAAHVASPRTAPVAAAGSSS